MASFIFCNIYCFSMFLRSSFPPPPPPPLPPSPLLGNAGHYRSGKDCLLCPEGQYSNQGTEYKCVLSPCGFTLVRPSDIYLMLYDVSCDSCSVCPAGSEAPKSLDLDLWDTWPAVMVHNNCTGICGSSYTSYHNFLCVVILILMRFSCCAVVGVSVMTTLTRVSSMAIMSMSLCPLPLRYVHHHHELVALSLL